MRYVVWGTVLAQVTYEISPMILNEDFAAYLKARPVLDNLLSYTLPIACIAFIVSKIEGIQAKSRSTEFACDALAVKTTGDPEALKRFFETHLDIRLESAFRGLLGDIFSTHPSDTRRCEAIDRVAKEAKIGPWAADAPADAVENRVMLPRPSSIIRAALAKPAYLAAIGASRAFP